MSLKISIDEAPAGPAMDAAVAKASGWIKVECDGVWYWSEPTADEWHTGRVVSDRNVAGYKLEDMKAWSPSTDIAAAWELESKLPYFKVIRLSKTRWQCKSAFCGDWFDHLCSSCGCQSSDAETTSLAICRAFLKANGIEYIEVLE